MSLFPIWRGIISAPVLPTKIQKFGASTLRHSLYEWTCPVFVGCVGRFALKRPQDRDRAMLRFDCDDSMGPVG